MPWAIIQARGVARHDPFNNRATPARNSLASAFSGSGRVARLVIFTLIRLCAISGYKELEPNTTLGSGHRWVAAEAVSAGGG